MQLRAGKYGDDQIFIIYAETNNSGNNGYGNVAKGIIPKVYIVRVPDMEIIVSDKKYDKLLMNTNEDLRTFRDGVLILGTANKEGKLVINKIGTPLLDNSYEDIDEIITKDDVDKIKDEINGSKEGSKNQKDEEKDSYSLSGGEIAGIIIGCIFGIVILVAIIYYLLKRFKIKNTNYNGEYNDSSKRDLLTKN